MKKLIVIAAAVMLAGCISIEDKGFNLIRERRVDVTATGFESLQPGRYRFMVECKNTSCSAWYTGILTVHEDRKYTFGDNETEAR